MENARKITRSKRFPSLSPSTISAKIDAQGQHYTFVIAAVPSSRLRTRSLNARPVTTKTKPSFVQVPTTRSHMEFANNLYKKQLGFGS